VQYVVFWASGAPNSRAAPGSPHSSYATGFMTILAQRFNNGVQTLEVATADFAPWLRPACVCRIFAVVW